MNPHWRKELRWLAIGLLVSLSLGATLGQFAWCLVAFLLLLNIRHYRELYRFARWLKEIDSRDPPYARGAWEDLEDHTYKLNKDFQHTVNELQGIITRVQDSTAALKDAVVMVNQNGNLEWWNKTAQRLLGLRYPSDEGMPLSHFVRDPDFKRYFERADYQEPLELISPVDPGTILQFDFTLFGFNERILLVRDCTRIKKLEKMRRDFVSNMSHELRTPLTVINGYLETILDNPNELPNWINRALEQMKEQGDRMQMLLADLLLLSRLETTAPDQKSQKLAMAQMLETIKRDALAYSGGQHDIKIDCEDNLYLQGDEQEIHSAVSNLVINAVKYSADGLIQIHWWSDAHGAHLAVQDQGIGIDERHIVRLTERFYRVDSSRASKTGGTGLGLAIVKHVLIRHGGELGVESQIGKGSTFTCHFPSNRILRVF